MTDEELIKEFWINLRAMERANEVADPEFDREGHWAAFESATLSADMEWFANYEGHCADELNGPLIDEARKLLENWRNDDIPKPKSKTGPATSGETISTIPNLPADNPLFKMGWVIGATRLRNSFPKANAPKPTRQKKSKET